MELIYPSSLPSTVLQITPPLSCKVWLITWDILQMCTVVGLDVYMMPVF